MSGQEGPAFRLSSILSRHAGRDASRMQSVQGVSKRIPSLRRIAWAPRCGAALDSHRTAG